MGGGLILILILKVFIKNNYTLITISWQFSKVCYTCEICHVPDAPACPGFSKLALCI